ncbi:MAG: hypothetical protein QF786_03835 [Vicinamibacterales bacterium]|nr:hypothetical protein [Vicinamibacterales bacterium]
MSSRTAMVLFALLMIGGAIGIVMAVTGDTGQPTNRVWSPEHGHWHDVR